MDWRNRAACLDEDPELFFPIGNTGPAIRQIEEAKTVCRRCDFYQPIDVPNLVLESSGVKPSHNGCSTG